jgi:SAGA-associated factor 73
LPAPPGTRSATRSTYATGSLIDPTVYDKLASATDKKPIKITLKNGLIPTVNNPGNWQSSKSSSPKPSLVNWIPKKQKPGSVLGPPTPPPLVNPIDPKILAAFPCGRPFDTPADLIQCKHCRKPVYKPAAPEHIRDCLKKKQEKALKKKEAKEAKEAAQRKERNGGISPEPSVDADGKKSIVKLDGGMDGAKKTSKKRKAEGDTATKKKRKKDEPKKTGRQKGPVDVEKQCGVLMPNGQMCARSLTCKTHAMGLKRAVPGRSMRYDILLAQYQKKNHAKQHSKWLVYFINQC